MTRRKSLKWRAALAGLLTGFGLFEVIHVGHTGDGLLPRAAAWAVLIAGIVLLRRVGEERKQQSDNE